MKRFLRALKRMPVRSLFRLTAALLMTIILLISIPVLAWYHHQRQIAEIQRIRTPDLLYVSAACAEDVKYFDMSDIDIGREGSDDPQSQLFPFAVTGEYVNSFTLQFAHTTNNPFVYKIYEGEIICQNGNGDICKSREDALAEVNRRNTAEGASINFATDVVEYEAKATWNKITNLNRERVYNIEAGDKVYILKGNCLKDGTGADYLNAQTVNGRVIADGTYHEESYQGYSAVNKYAEPLYWQKTGIQSVSNTAGWGGKPFFKPFLIEVSWDRSKISNKETDVVYISVYRDE